MIQASPRADQRNTLKATRAAGVLVAALLIGLASGAAAHDDPWADLDGLDPFAPSTPYDPWLDMNPYGDVDGDPHRSQSRDRSGFDPEGDGSDTGWIVEEYERDMEGSRQRQRELEQQFFVGPDPLTRQYYEQQTREALRSGARQGCAFMTGNPLAQQRCYESLR